MAQTKKKRRRKQRGTQGGRIDANPRRSKPRTRAEAKARAGAKRKPAQRGDLPPTWRSSIVRGLVAAVMLAFYIPAGYFIDMTMWRRRERARIRAREE